MAKGNRRSDGRKMVDFFVVEGGERAKKQRVLYEPSQGRVRLQSKVLHSVLADDNVVAQLNEDATTITEKGVERLDTERVSGNKATEVLECVESTMGRVETNAIFSVAHEQEECKDLELESLRSPEVVPV